MNERLLPRKTISKEEITQEGTEYPKLNGCIIRKLESLFCNYCGEPIGIISEFDMNGTFIYCYDCGSQIKKLIQNTKGVSS